jgi:hypothetical protein
MNDDELRAWVKHQMVFNPYSLGFRAVLSLLDEKNHRQLIDAVPDVPPIAGDGLPRDLVELEQSINRQYQKLIAMAMSKTLIALEPEPVVARTAEADEMLAFFKKTNS